MSTKQQITPYPIRMEPELRAALEEAARNGNRSLHAEIIQRLEQSLDPNRLKSPGQWGSVSEDGKITFKGAHDLLSELQELTLRAQMIVNIFQAAQEDPSEVDISDPPDFPFSGLGD